MHRKRRTRLMDSLVSLAFKDLVSRFDETTVLEPESLKDLMDIYAELKIVFRDFEDFLHIIEKVTSTNED